MMMTPAYMYLYEFEEIPPEWLQYPNWEKERIIDYEFKKDVNIMQRWIEEKHKEIPEEILKLLNAD